MSNRSITIHEIIRSLNRKSKLGMIIKLDMSKAYDSISLDFLFQVLDAFIFS